MTDHSKNKTIALANYNNKLEGEYFLHITEVPEERISETDLKTPVYNITSPILREPFLAKIYTLIRYNSVSEIPEVYRLLAWGALEPRDGRVIEKPGVYLFIREPSESFKLLLSTQAELKQRVKELMS